MNKIGKMYQVKKLYWLLFPNKETATSIYAARNAGVPDLGAPAPARISADGITAAADAYSKEYKCNVTYLSPEDILVLLEVDGKYKKVLSCKGELSWTWFREDYNKCFEEVKER